MNYLKGLLIAVVFDVAWIMGDPTRVSGPGRPASTQETQWAMTPHPGGVYVEIPSEDAQLDQAGRLEDSLMVHLQTSRDDVVAIEQLADMYLEHGWYEPAIGPLARALQIDPSRRSLWSALDRAVERSGRPKITDAELTRRAQAFVEAVEMWGHGC
jgi:predicted Zn-dependent protease